MSGEFFFDFSSNKTTHPFLKKGSGKRRTNVLEEKVKFLRKGHGLLASDYHGETEFSKKRSESTVSSKLKTENEFYKKEEKKKKKK